MILRELQKKRRLRRKKQIRNKAAGSPDRPRLTVSKSLKHIYVQMIDDTKGHTVVSASSLDEEVRGKVTPKTTKTELSKLVGEAVAKKAAEKNVKTAVFDRNGYLYHGRVKALADAARKAGLKF